MVLPIMENSSTGNASIRMTTIWICRHYSHLIPNCIAESASNQDDLVPGELTTATNSPGGVSWLCPGVIRQKCDLIEDWLYARGIRHSQTTILTILRLFSGILTAIRLRSELALENLALWQQLAVFEIRTETFVAFCPDSAGIGKKLPSSSGPRLFCAGIDGTVTCVETLHTGSDHRKQ
jgi:hypothetical protein